MMKGRDAKFNHVSVFDFAAQGTLIMIDVALSLILCLQRDFYEDAVAAGELDLQR